MSARKGDTHYVARIVVESVSVDHGTGRGDDRRYKGTVANIVVSGVDLESLKAKASAHLALVEDGGDITEGTHRG